MQCVNHPGIEATGTCSTCGGSICDHCKVQMGWNTVCFQCTNRLAQGMHGGSQFGTASGRRRTDTCKEANQAFILGIISIVTGIFCGGLVFALPLVFGIVAVNKANHARKRILRYGVGGKEKADAGFVMGVVGIVLGGVWALLTLILYIAIAVMS